MNFAETIAKSAFACRNSARNSDCRHAALIALLDAWPTTEKGKRPALSRGPLLIKSRIAGLLAGVHVLNAVTLIFELAAISALERPPAAVLALVLVGWDVCCRRRCGSRGRRCRWR